MLIKPFALLVIAAPLVAQDTVTARLLPSVTVTRQAAKSPYDVPFAITTVSPDSMRPGQAHVSADQTLAMIPGVTVANRTNPSQDARVSVRGFGARSAFGVRSVRILRDGMPLTLPDGQTPLDYLDLESVGRIEVIRGTASALYGNASGGVIDMHSVAPAPGFAPEGRVWFGSDALQRTTAVGSGTAGPLSYEGNVGQTTADNYRQFSHQKLTNLFGRATTTIRGAEVALMGMGLHMPLAENPGALTQAQFDTAPRMADPQSITKKARKEVDQAQVGLSAARRFGRVNVTSSVYGGTRSLYNPLTFAVVDVERSMSGGSLRGDIDLPVDGLRMSVGGDYQVQDDDRKNWANCNGVATATATCPSVGAEKGNISLDQRELVKGGGPFALLELARGRLRVNGGVRSDAVRFEVQDHLISGTNPDDSGVRTLTAVSPVAGLAVKLTRLASMYANYSTAFETPTTTELGNQADGTAGLNRTLNPQYSRTVEGGAKGLRGLWTYDASLFHTSVRDELIPYTATSGRTYYQNAGSTRRDGVEIALGGAFRRVEAGLAYSYSRFRFADFLSGTTQLKGNVIPGIPEHQLQLSGLMRLDHGGFMLGELQSKSKVWANDVNTVSARAFDLVNLRAGRDFDIQSLRVSPMIGVNNVTNVKYAGSLAINAAGTPTSGKFFEPGAGRSWIAGARVGYRR